MPRARIRVVPQGHGQRSTQSDSPCGASLPYRGHAGRLYYCVCAEALAARARDRDHLRSCRTAARTRPIGHGACAWGDGATLGQMSMASAGRWPLGCGRRGRPALRRLARLRCYAAAMRTVERAGARPRRFAKARSGHRSPPMWRRRFARVPRPGGCWGCCTGCGRAILRLGCKAPAGAPQCTSCGG